MSTQENDLPFNYVPTESVAIVFVTLFGLTTLLHFVQACWYRRWFLIPTVVLCGIGEVIGWSGRLWGSLNPYNGVAFLMQIASLIISPSFMTAAIFSLLPRIVRTLGTEYSRLTPKYYNYIFITTDFFALVVQAAGGGIAASSTDVTVSNLGGNVMLAGIIIQLVAVIIFSFCSIEFLVRWHSDRPFHVSEHGRGSTELQVFTNEIIEPGSNNPSTPRSFASDPKDGLNRWGQLDRRLFHMIIGIATVVCLVVIRGVYRTIELSDGWNGRIISTQWLFDVFDGVPIFLSLLTLDVFHPGRLLNPYQNN